MPALCRNCGQPVADIQKDVTIQIKTPPTRKLRRSECVNQACEDPTRFSWVDVTWQDSNGHIREDPIT